MYSLPGYGVKMRVLYKSMQYKRRKKKRVQVHESDEAMSKLKKEAVCSGNLKRIVT